MMVEDPLQGAKRLAGIEAATFVQSGNVVGLGTGSTAAQAIMELGRRVREEELSILGIPTSYQAGILARSHGIPVRSLDDIDRIDVAIDGADEVDPQRNLIKGGGSAHTREKVIAFFAEVFIVVVDDTKLVRRLGERVGVPVEVIPMAVKPVMRRLQEMGGSPELRMGVRKDGPIITDEGNLILDVRFAQINDPGGLERSINSIPGVLENGLFVGLADMILVASAASGSVKTIR